MSSSSDSVKDASKDASKDAPTNESKLEPKDALKLEPTMFMPSKSDMMIMQTKIHDLECQIQILNEKVNRLMYPPHYVYCPPNQWNPNGIPFPMPNTYPPFDSPNRPPAFHPSIQKVKDYTVPWPPN